MRRARCTLIALAYLAPVIGGGCHDAAVRVAMLRELSRAPSPFVRVFSGPQSVDRPYKEVARLEVDNPNGSYTEMLSQLRAEARRLGADGLLLDEFTSTDGHFDSLSGVALIF